MSLKFCGLHGILCCGVVLNIGCVASDIKEVLLFPAMKPIESAPGVSGVVGPSGQL